MGINKCPKCKIDISQKACYCQNCGCKLSGDESESPKIASKINYRYKSWIKWLIICLFVVGVVLISYSTFLFSHLIPSKDLEIMIREKYLDDMQNNYSTYESKDTKGYIANSTLRILYHIPSPDSRYQNIHNKFERISTIDLLNFKKKSIQIFTPPDSQKYLTYDSTLSLDNTLHVLDSISTLRFKIVINSMNARRVEINDMIAWKRDKTRRASIMQILGLLLNQIGIILQLIFKVGTDQ